MTEMKPDQVSYIVIHTAAIKDPNLALQTGVDEIRDWHLNRKPPFLDIGYHYVIVHPDGRYAAPGKVGLIQHGRDRRLCGAHCRGMNCRSIGICVVGDGDTNDFLPDQYEELCRICSFMIDAYPGITVENIIGHHEINDLVKVGLAPASCTTTKTCPGKCVDMNVVRGRIMQFRNRRIAKIVADIRSADTDTVEPAIVEHMDNGPDGWLLY